MATPLQAPVILAFFAVAALACEQRGPTRTTESKEKAMATIYDFEAKDIDGKRTYRLRYGLGVKRNIKIPLLHLVRKLAY